MADPGQGADLVDAANPVPYLRHGDRCPVIGTDDHFHAIVENRLDRRCFRRARTGRQQQQGTGKTGKLNCFHALA